MYHTYESNSGEPELRRLVIGRRVGPMSVDLAARYDHFVAGAKALLPDALHYGIQPPDELVLVVSPTHRIAGYARERSLDDDSAAAALIRELPRGSKRPVTLPVARAAQNITGKGGRIVVKSIRLLLQSPEVATEYRLLESTVLGVPVSDLRDREITVVKLPIFLNPTYKHMGIETTRALVEVASRHLVGQSFDFGPALPELERDFANRPSLYPRFRRKRDA